MRDPIPRHLYEYLVIEARGLCSLCHEETIDEIHHIRPVAAGGTSVYENLIPLCASCHDKLHKSGISSRKLKVCKRKWARECDDRLTAIIACPAKALLRNRRVVAAFTLVENTREFSDLRRCLRQELKARDVFDNFISVRRHDIVHRVDRFGNVAVTERMTFAPFRVMRRKGCHITSTTPASDSQVQFSARGWIGRREVAVAWRTSLNQPRLKHYDIVFPRSIQPRQHASVEFTYRWPRGWTFPADRYAYDVRAWAEDIRFKIQFPATVCTRKVASSYINIMGAEWPNIGKCTLQKHGYRWRGTRLPIFSRVVLAHTTTSAP